MNSNGEFKDDNRFSNEKLKSKISKMLEKMMAKSDINNISKISEIESNASIQFLD